MAASGVELGIRRFLDGRVELFSRSLGRAKVVALATWKHSARMDLSGVTCRSRMALLHPATRISRRARIDPSPSTREPPTAAFHPRGHVRTTHGKHVALGLGMASIRETRGSVKRCISLVGLLAMLAMLWAQNPDSDPRGLWSVRWFLVRAVEDGNLSVPSAEIVLSHLSRHGSPRAPEEAWRIEGLRTAERAWLVSSEGWHAVCQPLSTVREPAVRGAFTSLQRWAELRTTRRDLRMQFGSLRTRVRSEASVDVSGSWGRSRSSWSWVLGDHALGWGQGLTVPRSDPFGLAFFLGSSELRLPASPLPLYHSDFAGGLRGAALEHAGVRWSAGIGAGKDHLAGMVRRSWSRHEGTWSCFYSGGRLRWGVDWTGRRGTWDGQAALARSDGATAVRLSCRLARSSSFALQAGGDLEVNHGAWAGEVRGYATWEDPVGKGNVQLRVRGRSEDGGDVRLQGRIRKDHALKWSFLGTSDQRILGLHWVGQGVRATLWTGRDATGRWSTVRHVEAQWTLPGGGIWGLFGLDGQASWTGTYVALPALDVRHWSHAPRAGSQLGVWWRSELKTLPLDRVPLRSSWQASWAPSQQESFRCTWRVRWEA